MTLDDRLRAAHRRQLDDTRDRVAGARLDTSAWARSRQRQRLALAAAVAGLAVAVGFGTAALSPGRGPRPAPAADLSPTSISSPAAATPGSTASPALTSSPATPSSLAPPSSPATPVAPSPAPSLAAHSPSAPLPDPPTTAVLRDPAPVANEVCPSGWRAPLETATLRYLGANEGWGRLDDLVDEQDGPYYFETWEPGYPDAVTVEVTLAAPVRVTEIRVAQDPFNPVSGTVVIDPGDDPRELVLAGTGGWQATVFTPVIPLDRFTVTRSATTTNVVEVLVCVEAGR